MVLMDVHGGISTENRAHTEAHTERHMEYLERGQDIPKTRQDMQASVKSTGVLWTGYYSVYILYSMLTE